jgi:hypothetical protein
MRTNQLSIAKRDATSVTETISMKLMEGLAPVLVHLATSPLTLDWSRHHFSAQTHPIALQQQLYDKHKGHLCSSKLSEIPSPSKLGTNKKGWVVVTGTEKPLFLRRILLAPFVAPILRSPGSHCEESCSMNRLHDSEQRRRTRPNYLEKQTTGGGR